MKNNYTVLILAAGYGSRMKSLGEKNPKCLLKINNKTILEYILDHLKSLKVKNVVIAVGYKPYRILKIIKKYSKYLKINFYKVKNYRKVGSAYSWYLFKNVWKYDRKPIIMLHADIFFHYNLIYDIKNSNRENVIGSVTKLKNNIKLKGWTIETNNFNQIKEIKKKHKKLSKSTKEIACVNKFSVKSMDLIFDFMRSFFKKNGKNFTWEILLNDIIKKQQLKIYSNNYKKYWFNINTQLDYKNLKKFTY